VAEKAKFQAIKGVRDILPPESALWNRVEQTAREVFGTFGFGAAWKESSSVPSQSNSTCSIAV
jgi:hypothetical protein